MAIKVGINGCGRIGRLVLRMAMCDQAFQVVAVNTHADARTLSHLLKYDSVHGRYPGCISYTEGCLVIDGKKISLFSVEDPATLPWQALGVDLVIESTGAFVDVDGASKHLWAGAKGVLITSPAKDNIPTIVVGVNDDMLRFEDRIISSASCTTNCLAPMVKVLHEAFEIENGMITTVHAYTRDQNLVDGTHKDLRRARAASFSIVPTTTGAARAIGKIIPALDGKLNGQAIRVPVPDGSLVDFVGLVHKKTSVSEVNAAFQQAASGCLEGVLEYCEDPLVSADIIGNPHACIFDAASSMVEGRLVKICGWYDNEWSYAKRCLDLVLKMNEKLTCPVKPPDRLVERNHAAWQAPVFSKKQTMVVVEELR